MHELLMRIRVLILVKESSVKKSKILFFTFGVIIKK